MIRLIRKLIPTWTTYWLVLAAFWVYCAVRDARNGDTWLLAAEAAIAVVFVALGIWAHRKSTR